MGPLAGTVVVDLTRQLAGPQCTRVLSDLGQSHLAICLSLARHAHAVLPSSDPERQQHTPSHRCHHHDTGYPLVLQRIVLARSIRKV
jgi:hypothetical protein